MLKRQRVNFNVYKVKKKIYIYIFRRSEDPRRECRHNNLTVLQIFEAISLKGDRDQGTDRSK